MFHRILGRVASFAVIGIVAMPSVGLAVNECCVAGGSCYSSSGFPYAPGTICPGGNLCGCSVYGTNCQFHLTADVATSSGSACLTIGRGVSFDMGGHTLSCTGSDCGQAIKTTSSTGGTGATSVTGGFIEGCFDVGIDGYTAAISVDDMHVALGRSCTNGIYALGEYNRNIGINYAISVTDTQVHNTEIGVYAGTADLTNVALTGNAVGLADTGTTTVSKTIFSDNDVHVREGYAAGSQGTITISKASFVDASVCNAQNSAGSCYSDLEDGYVTITGTDPVFVCSPSDDPDRVCTIR